MPHCLGVEEAIKNNRETDQTAVEQRSKFYWVWKAACQYIKMKNVHWPKSERTKKVQTCDTTCPKKDDNLLIFLKFEKLHEPIQCWWTKTVVMNQNSGDEPIQWWWTKTVVMNQNSGDEPIQWWCTKTVVMNQNSGDAPKQWWWTKTVVMNQNKGDEPIQ